MMTTNVTFTENPVLTMTANDFVPVTDVRYMIGTEYKDDEFAIFIENIPNTDLTHLEVYKRENEDAYAIYSGLASKWIVFNKDLKVVDGNDITIEEIFDMIS